MQLLTSQIAQSLDSMTSNPVLAGNLLKAVNLSVGANMVSHGLGRNYVTFFVGNASAPARFSYGGSPDPATYLNIVSDAAVQADVLVL